MVDSFEHIGCFFCYHVINFLGVSITSLDLKADIKSEFYQLFLIEDDSFVKKYIWKNNDRNKTAIYKICYLSKISCSFGKFHVNGKD